MLTENNVKFENNIFNIIVFSFYFFFSRFPGCGFGCIPWKCPPPSAAATITITKAKDEDMYQCCKCNIDFFATQKFVLISEGENYSNYSCLN